MTEQKQGLKKGYRAILELDVFKDGKVEIRFKHGQKEC